MSGGWRLVYTSSRFILFQHLYRHVCSVSVAALKYVAVVVPRRSEDFFQRKDHTIPDPILEEGFGDDEDKKDALACHREYLAFCFRGFWTSAGLLATHFRSAIMHVETPTRSRYIRPTALHFDRPNPADLARCAESWCGHPWRVEPLIFRLPIYSCTEMLKANTLRRQTWETPDSMRHNTLSACAVRGEKADCKIQVAHFVKV